MPSSWTRTTGAVLAAAALVLAVAVTGPIPTPATAQAPDPAVQVLATTPSTGEIVDPGAITVAITTGGDAAAVEVRIAGVPLATTTEPHGTTTVHHGSSTLPPGDHLGEVLVDGQAVHMWRFTVAPEPITRIEGPTTVATGALLAARTHADGTAAGAVLVRADGVADALAGVALAARLGGPLLATAGDALSPEAAQALERALAPGGTVHLLGGTAALAPQVADDITALGLQHERHAGADRYDTAALAADAASDPDHVGAAYLVSGTSVADALPASVAAALAGAPILLTTADALPEATRAALHAGDHELVTAVGGTAVIAEEVLADLRGEGISTRRVAGADRFATAAAVATTTRFTSGGVSLAASTDPLATLLAAAYAAHQGHPLLLADGDRLPPATRSALADRPGGSLTVHGAVPASVARTARTHLLDAAGPQVVAMTPEPGAVGEGAVVHIDVDAPLRRGGSAAAATIGGAHVETTTAVDDTGRRLVITLHHPWPPSAAGAPPEVRVVALLAVGEGERFAHADWTFRITPHDLRYATADGIDLHEPSADVEMIGYHQSGHDGSRNQVALANGTPSVVMDSRGRGTGRTSAADIVANPELPVTAPATGTVVRAGSYVLYCDHVDHYLVIDPDQRPGWEVKLLHFEGLAVGVGERVVAGVTVVGSAPRQLPFASQVDRLSGPANWPHLHVEVVDPTVPDRPGGGC